MSEAAQNAMTKTPGTAIGAGLGIRPESGPRGPGARFMRENIRPKDTRKTISRLLTLFAQRKSAIIQVLALGTGISLAGLAAPYLIGTSIDRINLSPQMIPLALIPGLLAVYLFDALASRAQAWILTRLSQTLVQDLRAALFARITALPVATHLRYDHGDLMSRMNNDADEVAQAIAQNGAQIVSLAVNIAGSLVCMLLLSPRLTLAALATIPPMFLLSAVVSRRTRRHFRAQQHALGALNAHMEESVNGFTEVKAFEREALMLSAFDTLNRKHRESGIAAQLWAGIVMPMMNVINNLGFALITGLGSLMVLSGRLSPGLIASFIGYSKQFGRPLNELASTWSSFQAAIAGAERIFAILDEEVESPDGSGAMPLETARGHIRFENVHFSYIPGIPVLKSINLDVPPGTTVALVGPTGSGKTSIVNLLLRYHEPDTGCIFMDDHPLEDWTRASLRRSFAVVPQDCWLSDGSIADIISWARPRASREEIVQAAKNANAHGFIQMLPDGYDTELSQGGSSLSQGQRQLLAIARAALLDAPCLVLDEATSSIDTRTELHVQEAMLHLMAGKTCFIIAHRLSTILHADIIVLIEDGKILETGSHRELMEQGGRYRELYLAGSGQLARG